MLEEILVGKMFEESVFVVEIFLEAILFLVMFVLETLGRDGKQVISNDYCNNNNHNIVIMRNFDDALSFKQLSVPVY